MAAIVIADASPLIALARVNGITWLRALFTEVLMADAVLREVLTGQFSDTEERIQAGLTDGWLKPVAVQASKSRPLLQLGYPHSHGAGSAGTTQPKGAQPAPIEAPGA
ncbi:MAG: hypothetical protein VKL23_09735 [Cyanobacteriota bacterium]|nr:hypothetical protein [Cyanobacteriota bacterium]